MTEAPKFVTLVRVALSILAVPVVVVLTHIWLSSYVQQTAASQLLDDPQTTNTHLWLANNQGLVALGVVLVLWIVIWLPSILRYYIKH